MEVRSGMDQLYGMYQLSSWYKLDPTYTCYPADAS